MTYEQYLTKLVDEIFEKATFEYDLTWQQLAEKANLSVNTVYNLGNRVTRFPRLQTFYKLAKAVGMDLALIEKNVKKLRKAA